MPSTRASLPEQRGSGIGTYARHLTCERLVLRWQWVALPICVAWKKLHIHTSRYGYHPPLFLCCTALLGTLLAATTM